MTTKLLERSEVRQDSRRRDRRYFGNQISPFIRGLNSRPGDYRRDAYDEFPADDTYRQDSAPNIIYPGVGGYHGQRTDARQVRMDKFVQGALQRQLEHYESNVFRIVFDELPFAEGKIVPIEYLNLPGHRSSTYKSLVSVGRFKLHRNYATNIPMVNVLTEEITNKSHKFAAGYRVTDDDIAAMMVAGTVSIEQEEIAAVREAAMQEINHLIFNGMPELKLYGFGNHPEFLRCFPTVALNSNYNSNAILQMMHYHVTEQVAFTRRKETPDTLLLTTRAYHYIAGAMLDGVTTSGAVATTTTILEQFLKTNPAIKQVEVLNELEGAALGGGDLMITYKRDQTRLKAMMFEDFKFLPMQRVGLGYERPATFRFGGLRPYRPLSVQLWHLPAA